MSVTLSTSPEAPTLDSSGGFNVQVYPVGCNCASVPGSLPPLPLPHLLDQVWDYTSWAARMKQELQVEESSQGPSRVLLKLRTHQWLLAELETREELRLQASQLGQQALLAVGTPPKEVGPLSWCSQPTLT